MSKTRKQTYTIRRGIGVSEIDTPSGVLTCRTSQETDAIAALEFIAGLPSDKKCNISILPSGQIELTRGKQRKVT
jgi:hypothetical protein